MEVKEPERQEHNHLCYCLETNPLLIDPVLYHLVQYLKFADLISHRLVNTTWNRAITPRLKRFCRVVFRPVRSDELEELQLLATQHDAGKSTLGGMCRAQVANGEFATTEINNRIESFTKLLISSHEIFGCSPFCDFKLIDFPFDTEIGLNFFHVCGKNIRALDIRVNRKGRTCKVPDTFGGDFYPNLLSKKVPHLQRLVLFPYPELEKSRFAQSLPHLEWIHFKEWSSKELIFSHGFVENVFEKSVKLHEIFISIGLENCKSVENILIALASSYRFSYITKLHVAYLRLSHLEILHELALQRRGRLRLRSFRMEALAHDVPTSIFESFLRTQSVNLVELYCRRFMGSSKFGKLTFPRMLGLHKLDCELSARQVMPLKCNLRFPNLQVLNLFGTCCQVFSFDRQFCGNKISETVTSLNFRPGVIVSGSIVGLAEHFPCLKSLTISLIHSDDISQLLTCWEMLEDLELYFGDGIVNIDSILTGISAEECEQFLDSIKNVDGVDDFVDQRKHLYLLEDSTSLRNLKNLKTLHLEYNAFLMSRNPQSNANVVPERSANDDNEDENESRSVVDVDMSTEESYLPTNVTGFLALIHMNSLKRISLPECLLSRECCEMIVKNLDLVSWTFCSEASDIIPPRKR